MKKLFSIILIACLAMAVMAVAPISAANDEVLYGTPVIDGKVDEIYKSSLTIVYDPAVVDNCVVGNPFEPATGTFYALYDASYVYLCADVKDDDVVCAADSFVYQNENPFANDVVEFRLDFNGGGSMFKIGVDAFGKRAYTIQPDLCDIKEVEYACTQTEDGYVIEVKAPYDTNDKNDVFAAGKLGLKIWLFDLHGDFAGIEENSYLVHVAQYAADYAGEGEGDPVFYNLSEEKVTAPSAGDDTTAKTEDDTTAKTEDDTTAKTEDDTTAKTEDDTTAKTEDDTTAKTEDDTTAKTEDDTTAKTEDDTTGEKNPDTFDPVVIAVVLTAASGATFIVASKKKH